jgi:pimeloyl-ACP methyl ester carboxylesterase
MLSRCFRCFAACFHTVCSILSVLLTSSMALFSFNATAIEAGDPSNFSGLDVNIYWYGPNNASARAVPGEPNPWFDKTKPTVIYLHGWQPNTTEEFKRENFNRSELNGNGDVARGWRDRGWNIGIFYWNQLADEGEVKDAEAKIYTVDASKFTNATRWRDSSGNYHPGPQLTVTQQFVNAYKAVMAGYTGTAVRIVGHSLGAQLAITTASALWKEGKAGTLAANLVPVRVALLDAAYLKGKHSWINDQWTGEVGRALVRENRGDIAYEMYRTSGSTSNGFIGDTNQGLIDMTAFVEVKPWMYSTVDFSSKHRFAMGYYFDGINFDPPTVKCTGKPLPSAARTPDIIRELQSVGAKFEQIDGKYSTTPGDDTWDQKGDGC